MIVSGQAGFTGPGGFASNGFGEASPGGYSMTSAFLIEVILTAGFLVVILGATAPGRYAGGAPIAIGLALTLIHLVSIPVTNTSVNPARSTGVALFADGPALQQLWLFWAAPLIGGVRRRDHLEDRGLRRARAGDGRGDAGSRLTLARVSPHVWRDFSEGPARMSARPFAAFEWLIAWRYLRARRTDGGVSVMPGSRLDRGHARRSRR